jgi:chemotaxis signal transduction protein
VSQQALINNHSTGSYITFRAGTTAYALPTSQVRYIAARDTLSIRETPSQQGKNSQLFDYQGITVPLYRFSDLSGSHSQVDESNELVSLLAARRQDHIDWIDALEHSLKTGEPFTKATDPHLCAFGLWYDQYHPEDEELQTIMAAFDTPHKRIHSLGIELTKMSQNGEQKEALSILRKERSSTLKELLHHFETATIRLEDMVKPVVLVLDSGEKIFAVEVEIISDIKHFEDDHWLPDQGSNNATYYDGYFQGDNDNFFLNIVPRRLLEFAEGRG